MHLAIFIIGLIVLQLPNVILIMEHNDSFRLLVSFFNYQSLVATLLYLINHDAVFELKLIGGYFILDKSIYLCELGSLIDFDL